MKPQKTATNKQTNSSSPKRGSTSGFSMRNYFLNEGKQVDQAV